MDSRHYDPFETDFAQASLGTPRARRRKKRSRRGWFYALLALLLTLTLAASCFGSVCLYEWLRGHEVRLTGRNVVFHQVEKDGTDALSLTEIYEKCHGWVVTVTVQYWDAVGQAVSYGTGFVLSEDGYIATCAHVVDHAPCQITVTTCDGTVADAVLVAKDIQTDVAVLRVPLRGLDPAELGYSGEVAVGELAAAIGNPLSIQFAQTLTVGYISCRERSVSVNDYIMSLLQFDAAVNGGNSGGPLLNSRGQVIGMVNAKIEKDAEERIEGIGFAIPIDRVREVTEDLIRYGYVQDRPWLGITVQGYETEAGTPGGVRVVSVTPDSAADLAGLQENDWILQFNGVSVRSVGQLNAVKDQYSVGDTVSMLILRGERQMMLQVTLGVMPGNVQ